MTWHVPAATVRRYLTDDVSDAEAWSIEAHLVNCESCRHEVTAAAGETNVAPEITAVVARTRDAVDTAVPQLPAPQQARPGSRFRQYVMLSRSASTSGLAWFAAAALIVVVAVLLEVYAARPSVTAIGHEPMPWLAMVGPLVPVAGVAATYAAPFDDASELVAATPMSGLRLLLWRTLAVLVVVVPLSVVASVFTVYTTSASWLVPAFVLTATTVAVMSVIRPLVAAGTIGLGWVFVVGTVSMGDRGAAAVRDLLTASSATLTWLAAGGIAAAVIYLRRASYGSPSSALPTNSEEPW